MKFSFQLVGRTLLPTAVGSFLVFLSVARSDSKPAEQAPESKDLLAELKTYPHKLVY